MVGNAHPFAARALLVAPALESHHALTPATLPIDRLAEWLQWPTSPEFLAAFELDQRTTVAFVNVGRRAAQSRRHPHLQVVAFGGDCGKLQDDDAAAIAADLASAASESRELCLSSGAKVVVPRQPSQTAELWLPLPAADVGAADWKGAAAALAELCGAGERSLSGDYNLVWRLAAPALVRWIPRGLSERAGLEFAAPALLAGVVAVSVRESFLLWSAALALPPAPGAPNSD